MTVRDLSWIKAQLLTDRPRNSGPPPPLNPGDRVPEARQPCPQVTMPLPLSLPLAGGQVDDGRSQRRVIVTGSYYPGLHPEPALPQPLAVGPLPLGGGGVFPWSTTHFVWGWGGILRHNFVTQL